MWRFTGFYCNPNRKQRKFSWNFLNRLYSGGNSGNLPWLIGGDFNEILFDSEKFGGRFRSREAMQAFGDIIQACNLSEIVDKHTKFTWFNKRKGGDVILEKLDRYLASQIEKLCFLRLK